VISVAIKPVLRSVRKSVTAAFVKFIKHLFKRRLFFEGEFIDLVVLEELFSFDELNRLIFSHNTSFFMDKAVQYGIAQYAFSLKTITAQIIDKGLFNIEDILDVAIDKKAFSLIKAVEKCLQKDFFDMRELYSAMYIRGEGIEIGALNAPLKVSPNARVSYVDKCLEDKLKEYYTDIDSFLRG
jgi:hypothetical protein